MISNHSSKSYMIGIDIGGTNFRLGAVLQTGQVIHSKIVSSRDSFRHGDPIEVLTASIGELIMETDGSPAGICIGFPGTVSKDKTTVTSCPNLPMFDGINVSKALNEHFHVPVMVEHEVILLLCNDMHEFNLFDKDCVIAVYLGTGLGNSMYIHGRFLEGKNGSSGELGHIPVEGNTQHCPCGNDGCIELRASGKRLEEIRNTYFSETANLEEVLKLHASHPVILEFIDCVSIAIATEINILDPDCILLGGGVISIPTFPYDSLIDHIRLHTRKPIPESNLEFIRIPKDPHQGIRGAGIYGWSHIGQSSERF